MLKWLRKKKIERLEDQLLEAITVKEHWDGVWRAKDNFPKELIRERIIADKRVRILTKKLQRLGQEPDLVIASVEYPKMDITNNGEANE